MLVTPRLTSFKTPAKSNARPSPRLNPSSPIDRSRLGFRPGSRSNDRPSSRGRSNAAVKAPLPPKSRSRDARLQPLPNRASVPQWLQLMKQAERWSLLVAAVFASGAIVTYGWAMYSQQQWGQEYRQLEKLRRNERQLTTNGEMMKNNIARTTDPKQYGLVPRSAANIVVMPPAPPRPPLPMRPTGPDSNTKPILPIGY